jgi:N utilization substance protein A
MKTDFIRAINQVCAERGLTVEVVLELVEQALASAYKRDFSPAEYVEAKIDPDTGALSMFTGKEAVETVESPESQMDMAEARAIKPDVEVGEIVYVEAHPPDFGRIAAQTAKQVILQRIREAERDALYDSFVGREGEIVGGTVHSMDARGITINLGRIEALVPRSQQVPIERYFIRQKLRVLILEVNRTSRGPEIIASRSHPDMLRRLLEVEVPEIYNGLVEIKAIAREAGSRAKVAVAAVQQGIDPVGACVGMRGVRIQSIVSELNGEKIDVIGWSRDPKEFISKSLSPARPLGVELAEDDEVGNTATVIVPDKELSLAIGREGQNARLSAKLTGWRIDIIGATEAAERAVRRAEEEAIRAAARAEISEDMPLRRLGIPTRVVNILAGVGVTNLVELLDKMDEGADALSDIRGLGPKSVQEIEEAIQQREVRSILGRELKIDVEPAEPEETEEMPTPIEEETAPAEAEQEPIAPEPGEEPEPVMEAAEETAPAPAMEEAAQEQEEVESVEPLVESPEEEKETPAPPSVPSPVPPPSEELLLGEKETGRKKRKTKRLVYDENLGEVVARKVRKPGRRREDWERTVEDWKSQPEDMDVTEDVEEEDESEE